ncbi:MAG TPA: two-component regulator propeller domain-containing protein, partial [Pyrinomonadaceae bacterium]|nr:two-component regulator propeller domain-containing protein [Pyrinomonadaceae bacterium]
MFFSVFTLNLSVSAQYRFDSWTTDNGLPQNSVRKILQTSDGYIWLTTLDGLARFDGVRFTVFNKSNTKELPSNRFINLFADTDDTLWVSTEDQGIVRYRNGVFRTFTTADGLPSNQVLELIKEADGSYTAITNVGSAKFDGERFLPALKVNEVFKYKYLNSRSGRFWRLFNSELSVEKDGQKSVYELSEELKNLIQSEANIFLSTKLLEDSKGDLWISFNEYFKGFKAGRLYRFSNGIVSEIKAENMPISLVHDIGEDRDGNIWLATQRDGACRLNENKFTCYTPENGLPSRFIRNIFKDREGTLWITTDDKGIYQVFEPIITPLSVEQGLAEKNVYAILEDRSGAFWIGSHGALGYLQDGKITNYKRADGLKYIDVQSLLEDKDGRLWIGSLNGVVLYENGIFTDYNGYLKKETYQLWVNDIHQDRDGNLWFATNSGLYKYDSVTTTTFTTAEGLPGDSVKTILENADGSFWLGTYSGISLYKDGKFTNYTETEGLSGNHVRAIYKDENETLWIGTYDSGISRFKDGKFTNFTTANGLSSNGAFQILEDGGKIFWITSNQGIYRVSRTHLEEFAEGKRQSVPSTLFGKKDGMLNTEANGGGQPAGIKTKDGQLWFPTQDGVAILNPERVRLNLLPPPVVIEDSRIDSQKIAFSNNEIKVVPGQENLEINYTGLSFIKPEQIRFRYILEGLDKDWTEAGERRTAYFPHLPPGDYTFRVIAANSDNVWNEQGASIKITVYPAFYRTWWFFILASFAIAIFIYWIYRRRLQEIKRKHAAQEEFSRRLIAAHETERRRVAAELHDSLGQTLAMIKNRAVFARQNTENVEKAQEQFDQITEQSVEAINEVREISYNLRPYLLDRLGLTKALRSLFNKTAENTNLKIKAEIENIDKIFSSEEEMSIYRVIQESLNNIIKHAEAENVEIKIERTENLVSIKISDDGRGFSANRNLNSNKKGGFGLFGMAERIKILGGTHKITSALGKGTKISIRIDISDKNEANK